MRSIREYLKISPEQLAEGLCSLPQLNRIENGGREPEKLLMDALMQRLGRSVNYYETLLGLDEYRLLELRRQIQEKIDARDFAAAKERITGYRGAIRGIDQLHHQFLDLKELEIFQLSGGDIRACRDMLEGAMGRTMSGMQGKRLDDVCVSRLEMMMIEQYAGYTELLGEEEQAVILYERILKKLEQERYEPGERVKLLPQAAYRLAGLYTRRGEYRRAELVCERGIHLLSAIGRLQFLPELLELRSESVKAMGKAHDAAEDRRLLLVRDFCRKEGMREAEGWFPQLIETRAYLANDIIYQRRRMCRMSQEELAEGICTSVTISRIEQRKVTMQEKTQRRLLKKLGLSGYKYCGEIMTYDYEMVRQRRHFEELIRLNRYEEAGEVYRENLKKLPEDILCNRQSKRLMELRLEEYFMTDPKQTQERLYEILEMSIPNARECDLSGCILSANESFAIILLANSLKRQGKYKEILELERMRERTFDAMGERGWWMLTPIDCMFTMGDILGELGLFEEGNQCIKKGIARCIRADAAEMIPRLLYVLVWNTEQMMKDGNESRKTEALEKCWIWLREAYCFSVYYQDDVMKRFIAAHCEKEYTGDGILDGLTGTP